MGQDLQHWQEQGELFAQPMDELAPTGLMEFPYLLPFGDKEVLILGGRPVRYWVGHFDRQALRFIPDVGVGRSTFHRGKRSGCTCSLTGGLIEAFVNEQTCTTAAPERLRGCSYLGLFSEGEAVRCKSLDIWEMQPTGG